jgi:AraC family transcriptional regulator
VAGVSFETAFYNSHGEFYRDAYSQANTQDRSFEQFTLMQTRQTAGDWSDAASPDIVFSRVVGGCPSGVIDLGSGSFRTTGSVGESIIIPPNAATSIVLDHAHEIRFLALPFLTLTNLMADTDWPQDGDFGHLHSFALHDDFMAAIVDRLWLERDGESVCSPLLIDGALLMLGAHLCRLRNAPVHRQPTSSGGLAPWQVRRSVEHLRSDLTVPVSLNDLAAGVGLSPFHFARAFKKSTGVPPHRYLMHLRIERACALLSQTSLPVTEIAQSVGYESSQSLARAFAAEMGINPARWRRERRT